MQRMLYAELYAEHTYAAYACLLPNFFTQSMLNQSQSTLPLIFAPRSTDGGPPVTTNLPSVSDITK